MPPPLDPKDTTPAEFSSSVSEATVLSPVESVPPIIADRYAIERELGRGGMGVVYLARDRKLHDKPVVIKVLLEAALRDEWTVRKFQQEQEALARVDHQGVVGILDTGELPDGKPYIVMQYIEGVSLRDAMREKPEGMAFERAASIIREIGGGLSAVHEKKIFHRDLKPENIMLQARSRGDEQVKIVDFGIAKVKESVIGPSTVTGTGTAGTIVYMSPEHLRGEKVTNASDIYSFGVIAYEMVTGRRPFHPDTAAHLVEMQRDGVRVKPGALRPRLPDQAEQLILNALAFDTEARPHSAAEFGDALSAALMNEEETLKRPIAEPQPTIAAEPISLNLAVSENQKDVFISYSQADTKTAQTICKSLEKVGLSCWIAPRNIPAGKTWAEFIPDAISKSHVMVLVLSAKANESRQVKKEVDIADNKSIPIIPFRIEDVPLSKSLEYHLAGTQWLDAFTPPLSKHLQHLEDTVRSIIEQEAGRPSASPQPPRRWKLVAAAATVVLVIAIAGAWLWLKNGRTDAGTGAGTTATSSAPTRAFTYFLTPWDNAAEEERFTGNEQFHNGSKFAFVLIPEQSGTLYLVDRSSAENKPSRWYVLFPTPENNNGSSAVIADHKVKVKIFFDDNPADENLSIIWASQPIPELEAISKDAARTGFEIKNSTQIEGIAAFLKAHESPEPAIEINNASKQTTVRGPSNVLVSKLVLKHRQF